MPVTEITDSHRLAARLTQEGRILDMTHEATELFQRVLEMPSGSVPIDPPLSLEGVLERALSETLPAVLAWL